MAIVDNSQIQVFHLTSDVVMGALEANMKYIWGVLIPVTVILYIILIVYLCKEYRRGIRDFVGFMRALIGRQHRPYEVVELQSS